MGLQNKKSLRSPGVGNYIQLSASNSASAINTGAPHILQLVFEKCRNFTGKLSKKHGALFFQ